MSKKKSYLKSKIIIIDKHDKARIIFYDFFKRKHFTPIIIRKDKIIDSEQIVMSEGNVKYCGEDIISNTQAAIILDSGYMWPQPLFECTEEEWLHYKNNLDDCFRNQRESSSLWFSLLEVLNHTLPVCINPQEAFTFESFKPWAFRCLAGSGIAVPPFIVSNDKTRIRKFMRKHKGYFLSLPVLDKEKQHWINKDTLEEVLKKKSVLFLQALSSKEEIRVIAVNGKGITINSHTPYYSKIKKLIPETQELLHMPLVELSFRDSNGLVLSDFNAAPDLSRISSESIEIVLNQILFMIKDKL